MNELNYGVWVVFGYTIWIAAEYAWDWWKKSRRRKRQHIHGQLSETQQSQPLARPETPSAHHPPEHQPSSPVEAA